MLTLLARFLQHSRSRRSLRYQTQFPHFYHHATKPPSGRSRIWDYTLYAINVTSTIVVLYIMSHISPYQLQRSYGPSMLPRFSFSTSWIVCSTFYKRGRNIRVGDVVVAMCPREPGVSILKRVIALEGDFVCVDGDLSTTPVNVDGEWNDDRRSLRYARVPQGHFWLAGDNAEYSIDSRHYGPVPLAMIEGKALAEGPGIFLSGWSWIRNDAFESVNVELV